ncbi:D-alanine--D-alanine ligase [Acetobacter ghanensis]|uniref:ATP-binding protein n=1 Tax=Acetobacter ghanensis TaxID=431306 RepID=UPI003D32EB1C
MLPASPHDKQPNPLSLFEFWPRWVFYTPVVAYWILLGLRYRDVTLPTAANPRITTGGLCGEKKSELLDMAGPYAQQWIAPYATFTTGSNDLAEATRAMRSKNLAFPVVVKPDIGCNGTGVKLVHTQEELTQVCASFPRNISLVVQKLITWPHEAGLFYIRHPDEPTGRLTSLTYKDIPFLTGNGRDTVLDLLKQDVRTSKVLHIYTPRLQHCLNTIPAEGETLELVFAGNHCKGAVFRNGIPDITPELTAQIDRIMQDIPDFYFGRIDLKFCSVEDLSLGKNFEIIEINGVGAEAIHIWDAKTTLREAYVAQFHHYRESYRIGAKNKAAGWKPTNLWYGLRLWRAQKKLLASYPLND